MDRCEASTTYEPDHEYPDGFTVRCEKRKHDGPFHAGVMPDGFVINFCNFREMTNEQKIEALGVE